MNLPAIYLKMGENMVNRTIVEDWLVVISRYTSVHQRLFAYQIHINNIWTCSLYQTNVFHISIVAFINL